MTEDLSTVGRHRSPVVLPLSQRCCIRYRRADNQKRDAADHAKVIRHFANIRVGYNDGGPWVEVIRAIGNHAADSSKDHAKDY